MKLGRKPTKCIMKVKPVEKYNTPRYPMRSQTLNDPTLLMNIPSRWKRIAFICTAASALTILSSASCAITDNEPVTTQSPTIPRDVIMGIVSSPYTNMSISDKTLTDEEAIEIIIEHMSRVGVNFSRDGNKTVDASIPVSISYNSFDTQAGKLVLDGYDQRTGLVFEFISEYDVNSWLNLNSNNYIGFSRDDQSRLRAQIANHFRSPSLYAFYCPYEISKERAEYILRDQVNNYISWLKKQEFLYTTEDNALEYVKEKAAQFGFDFSWNETKTVNVNLPVSAEYEDYKYKFKTKPSVLELDLYNSDYKIGIKIISNDDIHKWLPDLDPSYNTFDVAMQVAFELDQELRNNNDVKARVLYIPEPSSGKSNSFSQQISQFIYWLTSQGII